MKLICLVILAFVYTQVLDLWDFCEKLFIKMYKEREASIKTTEPVSHDKSEIRQRYHEKPWLLKEIENVISAAISQEKDLIALIKFKSQLDQEPSNEDVEQIMDIIAKLDVYKSILIERYHSHMLLSFK